jgi:2-C-methyl-D-erythritol 4-phosphate cytidylyltransferase/2-C-methyl-D-erythritol 2,4-cyclodiphosphate synthase
VTSADDREAAAALVKQLKITKLIRIVEGGAERQDSVSHGLAAIPSQVELVAVHDGARPLVSHQLIERCVEAAQQWGTAIPSLSIIDTVKRAKEGIIVETLDRRELVRVQTPQTFRREILIKAVKQAIQDQFTGTDEAALVERMGIPVHLVAGEESNLKVTTMGDIAAAEAYLGTGPRIGFGYDIHRLVQGRKLFLGGVEIAHTKGLEGHSDADALLHAICDALLGAAGLADIGVYFPNNDPRFAGISSLKLLEEVAGLLAEKGFMPSNIDATVIAEAPKIAPHVSLMKERIAEALHLPVQCVGIKATTNEGIGSLGSGEGIAAYAVANLVRLTTR